MNTLAVPESPSPRRILLVCPQRIGDVLLATPLLRSMKRAWPKTEIDVLVFEGTESALEGNADVSSVIAVPQRSGTAARFQQLRQFWRQYDLAISPLPTDRARLSCWVAGRRTAGLVQPHWQDRTKALLLDHCLPFDDLDTHTVSMGLRLGEALGIAPCFEVVPPSIALIQSSALLSRLAPLAGAPYAVLHPSPKFRYKMWTPGAWSALAQALRARGWAVVFTGSAAPSELAYVSGIASTLSAGVLNLAGMLSLGETAELIRRAGFFVGPDTAVTHIAAATGVPTVALFGPSNPVKWGPWPARWHCLDSPWPRVVPGGSLRQGNVMLLQGAGDCVPCMLEGCERHLDSASDCLVKLPVAKVLTAIDALLAN